MAEQTPFEQIGAQIDRIASADTAHNGRAWFVDVQHEGERVYARNEQEPVPAASLNKLAIVHALNMSGIDTTEVVPLPNRKKRLGGTGVLQFFPEGYEISLHRAAILALCESDNVAAKLLVTRLAGPEAVNDELVHSSLGLAATRLQLVKNDGFYYGETSAEEAAALMEELMRNEEWANALRSSHVQYGMREGADVQAERLHRYWHDGVLQALRIANGRGSTVFYDAALARMLKLPSAMALKGGSLDDKEVGNVRHQVASLEVASLGMLTIAALSREGEHPSDAGYGPDHPAHEVHRNVGRLLVTPE